VGDNQCCGSGFIESGSGYGSGSSISSESGSGYGSPVLMNKQLKKKNTVENFFISFFDKKLQFTSP
jgi:hypothetical protein